jgi:hypothetical protein
MPRRYILWAIVMLIAVAVIGVAWQIANDREHASAVHRMREQRKRREREEQRTLRERSAGLMPAEVSGVALAMTLGEVRRARPAMQAAARRPLGPDEPELVLYEEQLPNGARVVYGFDVATVRLERVQLLSLLPDTNAIAPHLRAMNDHYGRPTGMWDCPNTGGVPTRRFTWRHGPTTISDVFLIYGGRVSVTLYIASTEVIGRSLMRGACRPLTDLEHFPVASPEDITGAAGH